MPKKEVPKNIQIYAEDFLKNFRKNKRTKQPQKIQTQRMQQEQINQNQARKEKQLQMDMRSQSEMEAQQLFGKLDPSSPKQNKQVKPKKKQNYNRTIKQKQISKIDQQQNANPMRSILLKGRISQNNYEEQQEEKKQQGQRQKQRKTVSFSGVLPQLPQKKWKDQIPNQKKGKFDPEQERILSQAVGKFLVLNGITSDQFQSILNSTQKSQKYSRKQKIFTVLSAALPNRSTQSCYKYIKRNFNSLNRQGKWTEEQVDKLKVLVQKYGRKWALISKQLKRTADNCYDKFRQLGQQNMDERNKGIWKFRELVDLLKLIQKMTKIKFLNHSIDQQLEREEFHDAKQKQNFNEHNKRYNSKSFIFHNIQVLKPFLHVKNFQKINVSQIRWNEIANYLKTRNNLDCRNKVIQLLQIFFHQTPKQLDEQIVDFLMTNKYQSEHQINWKDWKNKQISSQQAKNRYMILKKMIQGRSTKSLRTIIYQLRQRIQKKKNGKTNERKSKTVSERMASS